MNSTGRKIINASIEHRVAELRMAAKRARIAYLTPPMVEAMEHLASAYDRAADILLAAMVEECVPSGNSK
jgi:hypothetical protein